MTEAPATTEAPTPTTERGRVLGRQRAGPLENHQRCIGGKWVDRPIQRPPTMAAAASPASAFRMTRSVQHRKVRYHGDVHSAHPHERHRHGPVQTFGNVIGTVSFSHRSPDGRNIDNRSYPDPTLLLCCSPPEQAIPEAAPSGRRRCAGPSPASSRKRLLHRPPLRRRRPLRRLRRLRPLTRPRSRGGAGWASLSSRAPAIPAGRSTTCTTSRWGLDDARSSTCVASRCQPRRN